MKSRIVLIFSALIVMYSLLLIVPAPAQEGLDKYGLTVTSARLLNLTIIIPVAILWLTAMYGYIKLDTYQRLIADSKDGKQVAKLRTGLLILAIGLPLTSISTRLLDLWVLENPSADVTATILRNYLAIVAPFIAFIFISWGARGLADLARKRPSQLVLNLTIFITLFLGLAYVYLISRAPGTIAEVYHLTVAPFLFTLILPYTYMWFLGLFAAYEIYMYSRKVKGIVYRDSWRQLSFGLVAIIIFSILLQYLGTLSTQLESLSLTWILALVYVLLALWALSYVLVALGAKKLMKIEMA